MNTYTMDEQTWDMLLEAYEMAVDYMRHFGDESETDATIRRWGNLLRTVVVSARRGVEQ